MKLVLTFEASNESTLDELVNRLLPEIRPGDWVQMQGDLGAGKTTFVRHFLAKAGWTEVVASPTYPLCIEYEVGTQKYLHIDGFRLEGSEDPWDFNDWKNSIVFVEWASKTRLPLERFQWRIELEVSGDTKRKIRIFSARDFVAN